jgi:hypothetical protein
MNNEKFQKDLEESSSGLIGRTTSEVFFRNGMR